MALLTAHGLTRRPWFEGRDLELEQGEIVVLRGPSGSGKTLFLRALADLDPVDAGRVALRGTDREVVPPAAWRTQVLYVHPGGVRFPGTVADNVERVLELGTHRARAALAERRVPGLTAGTDAALLSSGESQVLAMHRALLAEPAVLLLDEPTAQLDPAAAGRWERRIRSWVDDGHAALWVTHDRALAERVGAREEAFP